MADWKERMGGAPSGTATVIQLGASSITVIPSNGYRRKVTMFNAGPAVAFVNYGATAVPSQSFPLLNQSVMEEQDYLGAINMTCASGASCGIFGLETGGTF